MTNITIEDIMRAKQAFDSADIPTGGRCLMLPERKARDVYGLTDKQIEKAKTQDGCLVNGVRFFVPGEVLE